jgi:hypothetical protein
VIEAQWYTPPEDGIEEAIFFEHDCKSRFKEVEGLNRQLDVDTAHLGNTGTHQDVPEESDDHLIEEPWWATVA